MEIRFTRRRARPPVRNRARRYVSVLLAEVAQRVVAPAAKLRRRLWYIGLVDLADAEAIEPIYRGIGHVRELQPRIQRVCAAHIESVQPVVARVRRPLRRERRALVNWLGRERPLHGGLRHARPRRLWRVLFRHQPAGRERRLHGLRLAEGNLCFAMIFQLAGQMHPLRARVRRRIGHCTRRAAARPR